MRRSLSISLTALIAVVVIAFGATLASGRTPRLGLDLAGGVSVVLRPKTHATSGTLDQAIDIIRNRVDALGASEPDISRQGGRIVVQLPQIKDPERARQVIGQTAQLLIRPVVQQLPATDTTPTTAPTPGLVNGVTPRDQDDPTKTVTLPERDPKTHTITARYLLGPAALKGSAVSSATATVDPNTGAWLVDMTFTSSGAKAFDDFAARVGVGNRFAFDLDAEVKSAPSLQTTTFNGRAQITGQFSQSDAKNLALVLRYGSLPVQLEEESVQSVSATLGKDSLHAGLLAGIVGLALVAAYMVFYYRALGVVVWLGIAISGALLYSIITYLGAHGNLALSLSGVTGIIVSVGVTVDSYVVYFERLKDEIRSGKTIRSSVDRGFSRAYRTIVAADLVSLIGAALLYILTVGPVRGFAFFLGLSTALDLLTAYFFTRPMVVLLGRNRLFTEARWLGVARGLAAAGATS